MKDEWYCLKCGARALLNSDMCFAHATTDERGLNADVEADWIALDDH